MSRGIAVAALTLALLFTGAHAHAERWKLAATLSIDSDAGAASSQSDERDGQASFGTTLRGLYGKSKYLRLGAGLDYRLGATWPGGFLYSFNLYPAGLGFVLSDLVTVGVYGGIGISGVTERIPFAAQLPVEARIDLRLGQRLHLSGSGTATWALRDARKDGSQTLGFADELGARLVVRWGKRYNRYSNVRSGDGFHLGIAVSEQLGSRMILGVFGYSMDGFVGDR